MEEVILKALNNADRCDSAEELATYIADELKRAIVEQLMHQLNHI